MLLISVYQYSFLGVKLLGHEINNSPPYSAEVKNEWNYISAPTVCLHGMDRENLIFPLPSYVEMCECLISVCQALEVCTKV